MAQNNQVHSYPGYSTVVDKFDLSSQFSVGDVHVYLPRTAVEHMWILLSLMCSTTVRGVVQFFICGTLCIAVGYLLMEFRLQQFIINYVFKFRPGGKLYNEWLTSSGQLLYLKFYAFNITNPKEFMAGEEKLKLQEVGPFVYRELITQEDVVFNDNGTLTSKPKYESIWDPEQNELDENVTLYVPNIPTLCLAHMVATQHPLLTIPINALLLSTESNATPILKTTWRKYGFGLDSTLVTVGSTLFPNWIRIEKLGFVTLFNDYKGVTTTLHTGANNSQVTSLVDRFRGLDHLPQWESPCNKIQNVSLGFKVKANLDDEEGFEIYFKQLCRTLPLVPTGIRETRNGIPTMLYKFHDDAMDNGARNAANKCYCKNGECLPEGLSDISDCFFGFSGVLSYPHLYKANSSLLENFEGLKPKQELHESYIRANQDLGIITEISAKIQFNLRLDDLSGFGYCSRFSNMILPIAWVEVRVPHIPLHTEVLVFILLRVLPIVQLICSGAIITFGIRLFFHVRNDMFESSKLLPRLRMMSQDLGSVLEAGQPLRGRRHRLSLDSDGM